MGIPTLEASEQSSKFKLEKGNHPCLYYKSQNWDFLWKRDGEKSKCHCFCSSIAFSFNPVSFTYQKWVGLHVVVRYTENNKQTQNIMLRYDQQTH